MHISASQPIIATLARDPRVRFLLAGGTAAAISLTTRALLGLVLPFAWAVLLASAVALTFGFVAYRQWVFHDRNRARPLAAEIAAFLAVNAVGTTVTFAAAVAIREGLLAFPGAGPHALLDLGAHALGIAVGAVANFLGHRKLTFAA